MKFHNIFVLLMKMSGVETKFNYESHLFMFNNEPVNYRHFDVSSCFEEDDKTHLSMEVEGKCKWNVK